MNPLVIAAAWLALGLLTSALLRRRTARLVAIVPLVGAGLTLLATRSSTAAVPLGRPERRSPASTAPARGCSSPPALSMTLVMLLQPSIDVSVGRTIGVVGAAATVAMASSDPLVTAPAP